MEKEFKKIKGTEDRNDNSMNLSSLSINEIVKLMHNENNNVMYAVENSIPNITKVSEEAFKTISNGGRLIYIGAGTSGRLGVLDASECPPTFNVSDDVVIGLIAGGDIALRNAIEGAEDDKQLGENDLKKINLKKSDMVIGIAASGKTPYVIGALEYAKNVGCYTSAIVNNHDTILGKIANETIELLTGAEVLTGSTRLKAGTAQKIVLNMISTSVMVRMGKVYENLMIDVKPTNEKLKNRAEQIVMKIAKVDNEKAKQALNANNWNCKKSIEELMNNKR